MIKLKTTRLRSMVYAVGGNVVRGNVVRGRQRQAGSDRGSRWGSVAFHAFKTVITVTPQLGASLCVVSLASATRSRRGTRPRSHRQPERTTRWRVPTA